MLDIQMMKEQHADILAALSSATQSLDARTASTQPAGISNVLEEVAAQIETHLKIEDTDVYPDLVESSDPEVKRIAEQFQRNMSGIAHEFADYVARYKSPENIAANASLFCYESRRIFERMRHRIQREEAELYPLLDRYGSVKY